MIESYDIPEEFEVGKIYYHCSEGFAGATNFFKVLDIHEEVITVISVSNYQELLRDDLINIRSDYKVCHMKDVRATEISQKHNISFVDALTVQDLNWHQPDKKFFLENSLEVLDIDTFPFCIGLGAGHIALSLKPEDKRDIRLHKLLKD